MVTDDLSNLFPGIKLSGAFGKFNELFFVKIIW